MNWLARKVFGNGCGTGAPHFDTVAYWLVDTKSKRDGRHGRFYTWIGGFGAQLNSFEWRCPKPGTRRRLAGLEFEVFNVSRGWVRDPWLGFRLFPILWSVSWRHTKLKPGCDVTVIRKMRSRLTDPMADWAGELGA